MGREHSSIYLYSLIYFPTKALTWEIEYAIVFQDPIVSKFEV